MNSSDASGSQASRRRVRRSLALGSLTALTAAGTVFPFHSHGPEAGWGLMPLILRMLPVAPAAQAPAWIEFGAAAACGVAAAWVGSVVQPRRIAWGLVAAGVLLTVTQSMLLVMRHTVWEPLPAILAMVGGCLAACWRNALPAGATPWFRGRVSPALLERLSQVSDPGFLSPAQRPGTVLTCRLLNEGALREILPAPDFLKLCESFRAQAAGVLLPHGACLDPTESTGVRAFFGLPLASETAADEAVRAALALERAFQPAETAGESGDSPLPLPRPVCGTGLATGTFTAGLAGNTYSVLGDAVEISRWLASLNSDYRTGTLLDAATHLRAGQIEDRPLEVLNPPEGAAMEIFHLLGVTGSLSVEDMARRDAFRDAIILLRAGHAGDAMRRFADAGEGLTAPDPALEHFLAQAADQARRDAPASASPPAGGPAPPLPLPPRRRLPFPRKLPRP